MVSSSTVSLGHLAEHAEVVVVVLRKNKKHCTSIVQYKVVGLCKLYTVLRECWPGFSMASACLALAESSPCFGAGIVLFLVVVDVMIDATDELYEL